MQQPAKTWTISDLLTLRMVISTVRVKFVRSYVQFQDPACYLLRSTVAKVYVFFVFAELLSSSKAIGDDHDEVGIWSISSEGSSTFTSECLMDA